MNSFIEILKNVPNYHDFMTVEELDNSSRELANEFEEIELFNIGKSTSGRHILCLKIGNGKKNALVFAFPHPNEPIGSLTVEFLSRYLAENPDFTEKLGYTWYFIKAIDPDGAALNEGWFKGKFNPLKYAKHYYRPPMHEQIEWTFPIEYKNLNFSNPAVETQCLIKLINEIKPAFMFSLHNAGFCGVYWYVSHEIKELYPELINLVEHEQLPVHRGEPEAQFMKKLHTAIFQMFGVEEIYDFFKENGVEEPQELIKCGTSSDDYLKRVTNGEGFTLVCEMPYFYDKSLEDDSPSEYNRREIMLDLLNFYVEVHQYAKAKFERIRKYCDMSSRIVTSVKDFIDNFGKRLKPEIQYAKTAEKYEGKATVAQAFDCMVSSRYYSTLSMGMLARLCEEIAIAHPESKDEMLDVKRDLDLWIEKTVNEILNKTSFEVIPIQKLVKIQVGSALLAIQHL